MIVYDQVISLNSLFVLGLWDLFFAHDPLEEESHPLDVSNICEGAFDNESACVNSDKPK